MCKAFPSIDWTKATWKVKQPAALWAEIRYAYYGYPGSPLILLGNGPAYDYASMVGTIPQYDGEPVPGDTVAGNVYYGVWAYHMRAGEFVATYNGSCQWATKTRERLCPDTFSILVVNGHSPIWYAKYKHFTPVVQEWTHYRVSGGDPISGPFTVFTTDTGYSANEDWISWRHVMLSAQCEFIPAMESRGFTVSAYAAIDYPPSPEYALELIRSPPSRSSYYRPTAMDLAMEWSLSGGLSFGFESNSTSPLYGNFVIYEGGFYTINESLTINILKTDDGNLDQYQNDFTFKVFEYIQFKNPIIALNWLAHHDETPQQMAARIAVDLHAALDGFSIDGIGYHIAFTVTLIGSSVRIDSTTIDSHRGGYPMEVGFRDQALNFVLGMYSVTNATRQQTTESSPWQLVNRPAVVAEFGVVNRFERTDDNDTLPAWIELELIPV